MLKIIRTALLLCAGLIVASACTSDDSVSDIDDALSGIKDNENSEWLLTSNIKLTESEETAAEGMNDFSYRLIKEAAASDNGSFCMSPVSVSIYLGMLANASAGETRTQILNALGAEDINALNTLSEKLMHHLPYDENGSSISVSNRFWVANSYSVPEEFINLLGRHYNAGVSMVDFNNSATVPAINGWVSENTHGLIKYILEGDWSQYTSMAMVSANTVYFKGNWSSKFKESETNKEVFHGVGGDRQTDMMHQTVRTAYSSGEKVSMLKLDFEGPINYMELYLPAEGVDINELIKELTPEKQNDLRISQELCDVELSLPSFESEIKTGLDGILRNMGLTKLSEVDFSPMGLGKMPASVHHKVSVRVDEEGAEFAAMTDIWCGSMLQPEEPEYRKVTMKFDRPFIYMVRNGRTGAILLAGSVTGF